MPYTFIDIMVHDPEGMYGREELIGYLGTLEVEEIASEKGRLLCYIHRELDCQETGEGIRKYLGKTDDLDVFIAPDGIELPEAGDEWLWLEYEFPSFRAQCRPAIKD